MFFISHMEQYIGSGTYHTPLPHPLSHYGERNWVSNLGKASKRVPRRARGLSPHPSESKSGWRNLGYRILQFLELLGAEGCDYRGSWLPEVLGAREAGS
jgi:hypothetical protein